MAERSPQLVAALETGARIPRFAHLTISVGPGMVRAIFEVTRNAYVNDRYGDDHPLWRGSPPMGGDRVRSAGGNGALVEMACADLLGLTALMEAGQRRPEWPARVDLPKLDDPARPALDAALAELGRLENPMFIEIEQRADGSTRAWANVLRRGIRTMVRDGADQPIIGVSGPGAPLTQQESALRMLADGLASLHE